MRSILALLVIGACVATPCGFAAERFTSERPTPLKRLPHKEDDGNGVRFAGSVKLSGQFFIVWKLESATPVYRQITFYPDPASVALLPHPADEKPVSELDFTNRGQAGAMLRDLVTSEKPLPRGEVGAAGAGVDGTAAPGGVAGVGVGCGCCACTTALPRRTATVRARMAGLIASAGDGSGARSAARAPSASPRARWKLRSRSDR